MGSDPPDVPHILRWFPVQSGPSGLLGPPGRGRENLYHPRPGPRVRGSGPGARGPKPGARVLGPKPGLGPGARGPRPGARGTGPGAGARDPGPGPGARARGPRPGPTARGLWPRVRHTLSISKCKSYVSLSFGAAVGEFGGGRGDEGRARYVVGPQPTSVERQS